MSATADRTESLFAAAVALATPEERAAYLDQACAGDAALRASVEALLRAHDRAGHLLDRPILADAGRTGAYQAPTEVPGTVIAGRYKLLEEIGEGGMGTVWVAEQTAPVRRKVALKLVKPGLDSRSVLARFEAERQALALMDHPNIAKVLDGGLTDAGRPFFVMEYVKGVPITEYCDATRLNVSERLQLFVQVCQAVQHAHQKGIIHRDLKPSNILVAPYDDRPVPKVIDFGLAKAMHQSLTERTLHTAHEMVVGTPLYMSPEQAQLNNLDVDTRSDIYSLGVLLYELLTGTTPLEKRRVKEAAWDEVRRIIREEEPPRPSKRLSTTKTLPSLAACRHTEPTSLTKLVRGELDWIVMKALEKDRTRRYETANGFALDVQRYLTGEPVLAVPPSAGYRLRKFARKHRAALAVAAAFVALLATAVVVSTGLAVWALRSERAAVAERDEREQARQAEAEQRRQADAQRDEAVRQKQRADEEAAIAKAVNEFLNKDLLAQADLYVQAGSGQSPERDLKLRTVLDRAAAQVAGRFEKQPLVEAALRLTIGQAYHSLGAYEAAQPHLERALAVHRRALGEDALETLTTAYNLARVLWRQQKYAQAEPLFLQALDGRRKALGDENADTLQAAHGLAALYRAMGELEKAEPIFLHNLAVQRRTQGDGHFDTLETLNSLGVLYRQWGKMEQSELYATQAYEGRRRHLSSEHPETLLSAINLGGLYVDQKKYAQAEQILAQSLEAVRRILTSEHSWTLGTLQELATAYLGQREFVKAEPLLRECLTVYQAKRPDHYRHFNVQSLLGESLAGQQKYAEAEPLLKSGYEGLKARERAAGAKRVTEAVERLVQLYDAWGKPDEAAKWRKELAAAEKK